MTSTASNSALDIASRALVLIGAEPITSFESSSTEALVASNMYEDVVRSSLCIARWRFATEQAILNQITETPTGRFAIAHQLPSDLLMLHTVTVNDNRLGYTVYADKIFSDASTSDVLVADYTFRASEIDFPSYFALAVQYALAGVFATAIARDDSLAQLMDGKADRLMAKARNLDSQQQTTRSLSTTRFATNRRS
jgi:hypothetical protein|tara:strand:- start:2674 stop:3261 length:588 start_codon:yes stop_codon:yes gene_type:complete